MRLAPGEASNRLLQSYRSYKVSMDPYCVERDPTFNLTLAEYKYPLYVRLKEETIF